MSTHDNLFPLSRINQQPRNGKGNSHQASMPIRNSRTIRVCSLGAIVEFDCGKTQFGRTMRYGKQQEVRHAKGSSRYGHSCGAIEIVPSTMTSCSWTAQALNSSIRMLKIMVNGDNLSVHDKCAVKQARRCTCRELQKI